MTATSTNLTRLHGELCAADAIIAKALGISELSQAAKIETRARELLTKEWDALAKQAASTAVAELRKGKGPVSDAEINRIVKVIDRTMAQWAGRVTDPHLKSLEEIYELAHIAAARKAFGLTDARMDFNVAPIRKAADPKVVSSLNQVDKGAVAALKKRQRFWIGKHYNSNVSNTIRDSVRTSVIEQGRNRAAGPLRKKILSTLQNVDAPGGFRGTSASYFEGLTAHAATTGRTQSQLNAFSRAGFTTYQVVNPMDHRTCQTCSLLDGKTFYVNDGAALMGKVNSATSPMAAKNAQPYLTPTQTKGLVSKPGPVGTSGTRGLASRGNSLPPYHYKCRCNIDVTGEESSLPPEMAKPIPIKPKPGKPKPVPKPKPKPIQQLPLQPASPRPPPDTLLDSPPHAVLNEQTKKLDKIWIEARRTGDYRRLRASSEKYLKDNWGVTQFAGRRGNMARNNAFRVLEIRKMKGFGGEHGWDGLILLREDAAKHVSKGMKKVIQGKSPTNGLRTLIHEVVHGSDRMIPKVYAAGGANVAEVSTELASRKIVLDMAGMSTSNPVVVGHEFGAYSAQITRVRRAIEKHTGWVLAQVDREMVHASMMIHTREIKHAAKTTKAMVTNFVDNLPSVKTLPAKQRKLLIDQINRFPKDW